VTTPEPTVLDGLRDGVGQLDDESAQDDGPERLEPGDIALDD